MTESLLQIATALSASTVLSIVVKASLALGLAMLAVRCARRARASTRHLILASTFAAGGIAAGGCLRASDHRCRAGSACDVAAGGGGANTHR
jgi:hypothetical protein